MNIQTSTDAARIWQKRFGPLKIRTCTLYFDLRHCRQPSLPPCLWSFDDIFCHLCQEVRSTCIFNCIYSTNDVDMVSVARVRQIFLCICRLIPLYSCILHLIVYWIVSSRVILGFAFRVRIVFSSAILSQYLCLAAASIWPYCADGR